MARQKNLASTPTEMNFLKDQVKWKKISTSKIQIILPVQDNKEVLASILKFAEFTISQLESMQLMEAEIRQS